MKKFIFFFLILFNSNLVRAELIYIENLNKNSDKKLDPTITKYYKGINSRALILFIPGGEGMFRFGPQKNEPTLAYYAMLKKITEKNVTSGAYDLVLMDSPYSLGDGTFNQVSVMRGSDDHLNRIESVINFYREKTKLPIIIMGHSNGGVSVTEFTKKIIKDNSKNNLLSGIIMSAARDEANLFLKPDKLPVIFLHHKNDGCIGTTYKGAILAFDKLLKEKNNVSFITIESGGPEGNLNACNSGTHMYYGSFDEVPKKLETELNKISFKN